MIGQYLGEQIDSPPDVKYFDYYKRFQNNAEDFIKIFEILKKFEDRMEYFKNPYSYYDILLEFTKLYRTELKKINEFFYLCLEHCKNNKIEQPYRIVSSNSQCGFVMVPIDKEFISFRHDVLSSFTHAHKYEYKLARCVGISFAYDDGDFLIDWCYIVGERKDNLEMEKFLEENYPFRNMKESVEPRYRFTDP
ncbi:MAG: hypothetical protein JXB48_17720 [Candidatus Latescibacteria bacterium]|nr:hypothetical protein [Candidatus Latescibacterota bacterium]